jgi:hypothetical protein
VQIDACLMGHIVAGSSLPLMPRNLTMLKCCCGAMVFTLLHKTHGDARSVGCADVQPVFLYTLIALSATHPLRLLGSYVCRVAVATADYHLTTAAAVVVA